MSLISSDNSGVRRSSASIESAHSPVQRSKAYCFCDPKPSSLREKTLAPRSRHKAPVPSVESSSTITNSLASPFKLSRHAGRSRASFLTIK